MNITETTRLIRHFRDDFRRAWLDGIDLVAEGKDPNGVAEGFANVVTHRALEAALGEVEFQRTGKFNPLVATPLNVGRDVIAHRFLIGIVSSSREYVGLTDLELERLRPVRVAIESAPSDIGFMDLGLMTKASVSEFAHHVRAALRKKASLIGENLSRMAVNLGVFAVAEQVGGIEGIWVTRQDNRVRDSHTDMHGQRRMLGDPFLSGNGNSLLHPHDPNAPIDETANCRCSLVTSRRVL